MSESPRREKVRIWGERIEAQMRSGKTIRIFCEEHRLKLPTFCYWRKKFCKSSKQGLKVLSSPSHLVASHKVTSRFVAVSQKVHTHSNSSPVIHLPNGVQVEMGVGLESEEVRQFLRSLCGVNRLPKEGRSAKS